MYVSVHVYYIFHNWNQYMYIHTMPIYAYVSFLFHAIFTYYHIILNQVLAAFYFLDLLQLSSFCKLKNFFLNSFLLATLHMWDLSSLTRYHTHAPCSGTVMF